MKLSNTHKINFFIYALIILSIIILPILRVRYYFPQSEVTKALITRNVVDYGEYKLITYVYIVDNNHYRFNYKYFRNKAKSYFKLIYNKEDPAECMIFSVGSIYLSKKMTYPWLIFIFSSALFFVDLNRMKFRQKIGDNDDYLDILE